MTAYTTTDYAISYELFALYIDPTISRQAFYYIPLRERMLIVEEVLAA